MHHVILSAAVLAILVAGCGNPDTPKTTAENEAGGSRPRITGQDATPTVDGGEKALAKTSGGAAERKVELDEVTLTAPEAWVRKPANSSFVAAEFSLPHAEGDDADGRLTVSTAGGSVEANIDRWKGQFQPQPKSAKQDEIEVDGVKVTKVDMSGDFNDARGPFAPGVMRPAYRLMGAVIPAGGQLCFVKATGPEKTIAEHADEIDVFIRTAQVNK